MAARVRAPDALAPNAASDAPARTPHGRLAYRQMGAPKRYGRWLIVLLDSGSKVREPRSLPSSFV